MTGETRVGKTTLFNHLLGKHFDIDYNDEGEAILVGEMFEPVSKATGLAVELNIAHYDFEGEEIAIV